MGKDFDAALQRQFDARRRKEEIKLEKQYEDASEEYIVAIYFFEQYFSPRCWSTANITKEQYDKLVSESRKLEAVKE